MCGQRPFVSYDRKLCSNDSPTPVQNQCRNGCISHLKEITSAHAFSSLVYHWHKFSAIFHDSQTHTFVASAKENPVLMVQWYTTPCIAWHAPPCACTQPQKACIFQCKQYEPFSLKSIYQNMQPAQTCLVRSSSVHVCHSMYICSKTYSWFTAIHDI